MIRSPKVLLERRRQSLALAPIIVIASTRRRMSPDSGS